jgi:hypothetical protein
LRSRYDADDAGEADFSSSAYRNFIQITIMAVAVHGLDTMRRNEPYPAPRVRETLAATGVLFALVVAVLVAVSYPVAVVAALAGAAVGAAATVVALGVRRAGRPETGRLPRTEPAREA